MALYAWTVLLGSFLLFEVQPIAGKYLLPMFGGSPSVWTVCLLFFQAFLLGGYAYAHVLTRYAGPRLQAGVHALLLLMSVACLPVTIRLDRVADLGGRPVLQVLAILAVSIGVPVLALSATSPLMQAWATLGVAPLRRPYRLYALSNVAGLVAVASYPFLVEPVFSRTLQAKVWCLGMTGYALLCLSAGVVTVWRTRDTLEAGLSAANPGEDQTARRPGARRVLAWLCLPACSSLLLMAVTNKICQDVAPVPFLWLLPLCLYLASWAICFDRPQWYVRQWCLPAMLIAVMGVCAVLILRAYLAVQVQIGVCALAFLLCCLGCHGELVRLQPPTRHLTAFYLMIGLGGLLGGGFVAVAAPLLFNDYREFQIGLLLCPVVLLVLCFNDRASRLYHGRDRRAWAFLVCALLISALAFQQEAVRFSGNRRCAARNFFGTLTVYEFALKNPLRRHSLLQNGNVTHGLQAWDPQRRLLPTSYYGEQSGAGLLLRHLRPEVPRHIGVVGMGIGTLVAYGKASDRFRFYEINPEVSKVAAAHFSYLAEARAHVTIVPGDGRLSLEREAPQGFDILVLDVFTSDAIPVHVLTREAFSVYQKHLNSGGVMLVNISNPHLDLTPVIRTAALQMGMRVAVIVHIPAPNEWWLNGSHWVMLSTNDEFLSSPAIAAATRASPKLAAVGPFWTDDYTALFPLLKRRCHFRLKGGTQTETRE